MSAAVLIRENKNPTEKDIDNAWLVIFAVVVLISYSQSHSVSSRDTA
jgi:hypothetical protein